jgi:hypothetical protein
MLVKRVLFLLNATFAMTIKDPVSYITRLKKYIERCTSLLTLEVTVSLNFTDGVLTLTDYLKCASFLERLRKCVSVEHILKTLNSK